MTVAVMSAYWKCGPWVRRAVEGILAQTYTDLRLYVVNDADPFSPWPLLEDIRDPRLIRFDLPHNRGRFFADAVVLAGDPDAEFWALMDPDDWSEPDRLSELMPIAAEHGAALAPHVLYEGSLKGRRYVKGLRLRDKPVATALEDHTGYASAVISTERIRAVGGFHAGVRVAYDTYLTNALKLVGPWGVHDRPFTHKVRRVNSLMTSTGTGVGSPLRLATKARLNGLWRTAWARNEAGLEVASVVQDDIPAEIRLEVAAQADRLRSVALGAIA